MPPACSSSYGVIAKYLDSVGKMRSKCCEDVKNIREMQQFRFSIGHAQNCFTIFVNHQLGIDNSRKLTQVESLSRLITPNGWLVVCRTQKINIIILLILHLHSVLSSTYANNTFAVIQLCVYCQSAFICHAIYMPFCNYL